MAAKEDLGRQKEKIAADSQNEGENAPPDPILTQRDLIITEIETSDGNLGASLRYIYVLLYFFLLWEVLQLVKQKQNYHLPLKLNDEIIVLVSYFFYINIYAMCFEIY